MNLLTDNLTTPLILLGISILGLIVSITIPLRNHILDHREMRNLSLAHDEAIVTDLIRNDLLQLEVEIETNTLDLGLDLPKPRNYRHNLHCPRCGRFSARVSADSPSVMACHEHGVVVRWELVPVDWASLPAAHIEGVAVKTEAITLPILLQPLTEPIEVIVPDDLSDLLALGATI